jgi:hypothetical protein
MASAAGPGQPKLGVIYVEHLKKRFGNPIYLQLEVCPPIVAGPASTMRNNVLAQFGFPLAKIVAGLRQRRTVRSRQTAGGCPLSLEAGPIH